MFGFLFGAACLLGLTATVARGRHDHHCGGHRSRGFGRGRGRGRGRYFLNRLMDRLDTTPGQEKVIREAVETLMDDFHEARRDFRGSRTDVAQAIRAEVLDRASVEAIFDRHDQVIDRVRNSALDAFAKIHETLDQRQRKTLADIVESGPFGRGFGPFGRAA
jgi:Spy/CpxP family protein refolding chaperone